MDNTPDMAEKRLRAAKSLKQASRTLGQSFPLKNYQEWCKADKEETPSGKELRSWFGSFESAMEYAFLAPPKKRHPETWSDDRKLEVILRVLNDYAVTHDWFPAATEWNEFAKTNDYPSAYLIMKMSDKKWSEIREDLGAKAKPKGRKPSEESTPIYSNEFCLRMLIQAADHYHKALHQLTQNDYNTWRTFHTKERCPAPTLIVLRFSELEEDVSGWEQALKQAEILQARLSGHVPDRLEDMPQHLESKYVRERQVVRRIRSIDKMKMDASQEACVRALVEAALYYKKPCTKLAGFDYMTWRRFHGEDRLPDQITISKAFGRWSDALDVAEERRLKIVGRA